MTKRMTTQYRNGLVLAVAYFLELGVVEAFFQQICRAELVCSLCLRSAQALDSLNDYLSYFVSAKPDQPVRSDRVSNFRIWALQLRPRNPDVCANKCKNILHAEPSIAANKPPTSRVPG
ncbi:hypothetical protein ASPBRDRAFT_417009 [Aspergillus brasiliensis CBS 101740]|uniref:Uncharacterized protein n=1 Tax=Aspergillus brasiliensis (strain CBS 101740 / IMI 381727 / IBT 21946) TaxID=767769 RepID=A0A1L9UYK2_ASPBC|nr:hypothetical protein ASPBRDRAFT_417009 [Aspergillus brasiliensis CBS 101740]